MQEARVGDSSHAVMSGIEVLRSSCLGENFLTLENELTDIDHSEKLSGHVLT